MRARERPEGQVEVTPEMVAAGGAVLDEHGEAYHQEMLAEAVYIAMARRRTSQRSPSADHHHL